MVGRLILFIVAFMTLTGCEERAVDTIAPAEASCRTEPWRQYNSTYDEYRKYREVWYAAIGKCVVESVPLSNWEQGLERMRKSDHNCLAQPTVPTISLKSINNGYPFRDGRILLSLNPATGMFRRISFGEAADGSVTSSRDTGCFLEREGYLFLELGAVGASDEGTPSSELFRFSVSGASWSLIRQDDNEGLDWTFCPTYNTPWTSCTALRIGGTPYFFPEVDAPTQASLLAEALDIRSSFQFSELPSGEFEEVWSTAESIYKNSLRQSWRLSPIQHFDPPYTMPLWEDFVKGLRPVPP